MRRSSHVTLTLLAGMAMAFTSGCRSQQERRDCVDEAGRISPDQNCEMVQQRRRTGYTGFLPYYHYVWGGRSGGHIGDTVFDGAPAPGMHSSSHSFFGGIGRGGFGSHGASVGS